MKGIFISYSPAAGFTERRFVVEVVRQLKENSLAEDIWFDADEKIISSPCWYSLRMEEVEKCRAAILVLSNSYFICPVSLFEAKVLLERQIIEPNPVRIFPILFQQPEIKDIPNKFLQLIDLAIDLTSDQAKKSVEEKTSIVVGVMIEELEKYACIHKSLASVSSADTEMSGKFRNKKICHWSVADLQEWLVNIDIKEFYCLSLAEPMVDGFLLMSLTDHDLAVHLGVDSRIVRKKIMQQLLCELDHEHKQADSWHLRIRAQRPKPGVIYIIYDPVDVRLALSLKTDLMRKNIQVLHHNEHSLSQSKEEFLQTNGRNLATASHVIVLMTEAMIVSAFIFQEVLFADWLGKRIVVAMFKNIWSNLRVSLKSVLGDCPAVDFETKPYMESLEVLVHKIKPLRHVPCIVLEQKYVKKMAEGLQPLEILATDRVDAAVEVPPSKNNTQVFISYQWDVQQNVRVIQQVLELAGFTCWADITFTSGLQGHRKHINQYPRQHMSGASEIHQDQIQHIIKSCCVLVCCITPKYLHSNICIRDLSSAISSKKPIIPLLLRYASLESAHNYVCKVLRRYTCIDLSTDRLYKQNVGNLVHQVRKYVESARMQ